MSLSVSSNTPFMGTLNPDLELGVLQDCPNTDKASNKKHEWKPSGNDYARKTCLNCIDFLQEIGNFAIETRFAEVSKIFNYAFRSIKVQNTEIAALVGPEIYNNMTYATLNKYRQNMDLTWKWLNSTLEQPIRKFPTSSGLQKYVLNLAHNISQLPVPQDPERSPDRDRLVAYTGLCAVICGISCAASLFFLEINTLIEASPSHNTTSWSAEEIRSSISFNTVFYKIALVGSVAFIAFSLLLCRKHSKENETHNANKNQYMNILRSYLNVLQLRAAPNTLSVPEMRDYNPTVNQWFNTVFIQRPDLAR